MLRGVEGAQRAVISGGDWTYRHIDVTKKIEGKQVKFVDRPDIQVVCEFG